MKNFIKEVYKPFIAFILCAIFLYCFMWILVYTGKLIGAI
jgi:lipopolysaccharide export LptBFGC system permease protein LptF